MVFQQTQHKLVEERPFVGVEIIKEDSHLLVWDHRCEQAENPTAGVNVCSQVEPVQASMQLWNVGLDQDFKHEAMLEETWQVWSVYFFHLAVFYQADKEPEGKSLGAVPQKLGDNEIHSLHVTDVLSIDTECGEDALQLSATFATCLFHEVWVTRKCAPQVSFDLLDSITLRCLFEQRLVRLLHVSIFAFEVNVSELTAVACLSVPLESFGAALRSLNIFSTTTDAVMTRNSQTRRTLSVLLFALDLVRLNFSL